MSTTEDEYEGYEKVRVRLRGTGIGAESFWAKDVQEMTDGSRFGVVDNMLVHAPFRFGDTVRFVDDPSGTPRVVEVLQRGSGLWFMAGVGAMDEDWLSSPVPQMLLSDALRVAAKTVTAAGAMAMAVADSAIIVGFVPDPNDERSEEEMIEDFLENSLMQHLEDFLVEAQNSGVEVPLTYEILSCAESPLGDCNGLIDASEGEPAPAPVEPEDAENLLFGAGGLDYGAWNALLDTAFDEGDLPRRLDHEADGRDEILKQLIGSTMYDPRVRATLAAGRHYDVLLVAGRSIAVGKGLPLPALERSLLST